MISPELLEEAVATGPKNTLADKKRAFLETITRSSDEKSPRYGRVVTSPIRYAGGKSLGVGHIISLLPDNIERVISPFFGGGSVEIACSKYLDLEVRGFDIFDILVNYWTVQISNPAALFKRLQSLRPNASTYAAVKSRLKAHWKGECKLSPEALAAHYYFNHNLSYGPGFLGWPSKIYLDERRYAKCLQNVRDFAPKRLSVKHSPFEKVFERYPNDFFYCDPPYYLGQDSKMFRGIYPQRNFPIHHNSFKHEELRDRLYSHRGGFILSYNDCPTIQKWYGRYQMFFPEWQYTMGQGETRIGLNRIAASTDHVKKSHEVLIYCPPRGA